MIATSHAWESYLAEHEERLVDDLCDFLRIPSISALPAHDADVARVAAWVAERFAARPGDEGV